MKRNNSIIKFNENELEIIKENIHSIYNKILNTSLKRMFINKVYKVIAYIILVLGLTILVVLIFTNDLLIGKQSKNLFRIF